MLIIMWVNFFSLCFEIITCCGLKWTTDLKKTIALKVRGRDKDENRLLENSYIAHGIM